MCLDVVEKVYKKSMPEKIGYKVMDVYCHRRYLPFQGKMATPIPIKKWIDEKDYRVNELLSCRVLYCYDFQNKSYPYGFHVYENLKDAKGNCFDGMKIYSVYMKDIVARGKQDDCSVFVAKKIKLIKVVN